jgi:ABC-type lipoprotein release transport system permease subunit
LASLLFNVAKYDLSTIAIVAGAILLVALLACIIPAMRAAKVSPVIALKYE